jgi:hypothetical protein
MKVKLFSKDVTVDVKFNTERLGHGNGEISYYGEKLGNTKSQQLELILNRMVQNKVELELAIEELVEYLDNKRKLEEE